MLDQPKVRRPLGRRLIPVGVVVVVLALGALYAAMRPDAPWAEIAGLPVAESSFPGEPWGADVLAQQFPADYIKRGGPYGWALNDYQTSYVNIKGGVRQTYAVPDPQYTLWIFGGSTTFGVGQRDEYTIASQLVRQAAARGTAIEVVNFGVIAYANWQGTELFIDQLRVRQHPDLVIFLDGINDWYAALERQQYGLLDPNEVVLRSVSEEDRSKRAEDAARVGYEYDYDIEQIAVLAAQQYRSGVLRARDAARAADIDMIAFWEPELTTTPTDQPTVSAVFKNAHMDLDYAAKEANAYRRAMSMSGVDPVDLTRIFDHVDRPIFFDSAHTNEAGARIEAAAILNHAWRFIGPNAE